LGSLRDEWDSYVLGLKHSGFLLSDSTDSIVWSWDEKEGRVTAKKAYEVQFFEDSGDFF
jgi:hypothetical protein